MNNTRTFWTDLPYDLCKNQKRVRYGRDGESQCWNGKDTGRYTNKIVSDGLAYQDGNPEVSVDVNRPDTDINEQIIALKLITKRLESAQKGQNVDWPTTSECKFSRFQIQTKIQTNNRSKYRSKYRPNTDQ